MSQGKVQKHHPGGPGHREGISPEMETAMLRGRIAALEEALSSLIDAVEAKNQRKIDDALFVGHGLLF